MHAVRTPTSTEDGQSGQNVARRSPRRQSEWLEGNPSALDHGPPAGQCVTKRPKSKSASDELGAAHKKIAKLEAREAEHEHAAKVQSALYRIAEMASAAQDMPAFYAKIHEIVGKLMYADNFYIALYDEERQLINFPFYRDEVDPEIPDPNAWDHFGVGEARGATAYVLRHGKPKRLRLADWKALTKKGEIELVGSPSVEWLGVPLKADGRTVGVIAVQTYREDRRYSREDLDLLVFVAQHVGSALVRPVPSRRRGDGTRSWQSSTRSARRWPSSWTSRRSSSSSANGSPISSMRRRSSSPSTTKRRGNSLPVRDSRRRTPPHRPDHAW